MQQDSNSLYINIYTVLRVVLQQAKSSNIQAQLASTAAQVQALEQQKHELEASNVFLRQTSSLQQGGQVRNSR